MTFTDNELINRGMAAEAALPWLKQAVGELEIQLLQNAQASDQDTLDIRKLKTAYTLLNEAKSQINRGRDARERKEMTNE